MTLFTSYTTYICKYADTTYFYKNLSPRKLTDTNSMDFLGDKQEACPGRSPVWRKRNEYLKWS